MSTIFLSINRPTKNCALKIAAHKKKFTVAMGMIILCPYIDYTKEKSEREHDGPKPVTAKCFRTLLPSDKVDVHRNVHFST